MNQVKILPRLIVCFLSLTILFLACDRGEESILLTSPDNSYTFSLIAGDTLFYSVNWDGQTIIDKSALGFILSDGSVYPGEVAVLKVDRLAKNVDWRPVCGERNLYSNKYNEALVHFSNPPATGPFALRIRAYNEGVAFSYEITSEKGLQVEEELTEFAYPDNPAVWASKAAQSEIRKWRLSELSFVAERPLLAELSDSLFTAIGEIQKAPDQSKHTAGSSG